MSIIDKGRKALKKERDQKRLAAEAARPTVAKRCQGLLSSLQDPQVSLSCSGAGDQDITVRRQSDGTVLCRLRVYADDDSRVRTDMIYLQWYVSRSGVEYFGPLTNRWHIYDEDELARFLAIQLETE